MTVYLIQCQQTKNVKIGYTKNCVSMRLKQLRTAASTPIELVKAYEGLTMHCERKLHMIYAQYHVVNEWFTSEVLTTIDEQVKLLENDFNNHQTKKNYEFFKKDYYLINALLFFIPVYESFNPYIDFVWEQETCLHNTQNDENLTVRQYFDFYVKQKGHSIMIQAYSVKYFEPFHLANLKQYHDDTVYNLRNQKSCSEDIIQVADSLDELMNKIQRECKSQNLI